MSKFSQKGVSLFLAIIILAVILAIVLGLTAILVSQIKMIRGMENSVVALYAADTGIEEVLKVIIGGQTPAPCYPSSGETDLGNGASYKAKVVCCSSSKEECDFYWAAPEPESCPVGLSEEDDCESTRYCVRSIGKYRDSQRAIEVKIYPVSTP